MKKRKIIALMVVLSLIISATQSTILAKQKKLSFRCKKITMRVGETKKLAVKGGNGKTQYKSVNEKYLKVSKKGVMVGKKKGKGKTIKVVAYEKGNESNRARIKIHLLPKIKPKKKMITLTFDDGMDGKYSAKIADEIQKVNGRATFFVIGSTLGNKKNIAALQHVYSLGNEIGNHTLNHVNLANRSDAEVHHQLNRTDELIEHITGEKVKLYRPPFGAVSQRLNKIIKRPAIMWDVDPYDWETLNTEKTVKRVMAGASDGKIVLLHSVYKSTYEAVKQIIPRLVKKGYQLVTVSELRKYRKGE